MTTMSNGNISRIGSGISILSHTNDDT